MYSDMGSKKYCTMPGHQSSTPLMFSFFIPEDQCSVPIYFSSRGPSWCDFSLGSSKRVADSNSWGWKPQPSGLQRISRRNYQQFLLTMAQKEAYVAACTHKTVLATNAQLAPVRIMDWSLTGLANTNWSTKTSVSCQAIQQQKTNTPPTWNCNRSQKNGHIQRPECNGHRQLQLQTPPWGRMNADWLRLQPLPCLHEGAQQQWLN